MVSALEAGYRLLDTAVNYGNEKEVGEALRRSGLPREDVAIATKIPGRFHAKDLALQSLRDSAARLGVDQVDVALIHWPNPSQDLTRRPWQALVEAQRDGLVRTIGVSNFTEEHLRRIIDESGVTPAVNQIELHPYFPQAQMRASTRGWESAPRRGARWASGRRPSTSRPWLVRQRRTTSRPGQVILRWHVQLGSLPLPKSRDSRATTAEPRRLRVRADRRRDGCHRRPGPARTAACSAATRTPTRRCSATRTATGHPRRRGSPPGSRRSSRPPSSGRCRTPPRR